MIIGLTGPMASGKSTVVNVLKKQGFFHITLSDIIRIECAKADIEATRDSMMTIGQRLREDHGAGVLGKMALKKLTEIGGKKWIVDGIRNPAEVIELRQSEDFVLIANTAPEELIISRILSRKRTDDTLDTASIKVKLRREMGEGEPPEGQQVEKCIKMADYVFENTMSMNHIEEAFLKLYNTILTDKQFDND